MPLNYQCMIHRSFALCAVLGALVFPFLFVAMVIEPKPIRDYKNSQNSLSAACWLDLQDICNRYFPPHTLKFGEVIKWGTNGSSEPFKLFGWYASENGGSWSRGEVVGIRFRLEKPVADRLALRLRYSVYHPSDKAISVQINGATPNSLAIEGNGILTFDHPLSKTQFGPEAVVNIIFNIEKPRSPAYYGLSEDGRNIALFMQEMSLIRQ